MRAIANFLLRPQIALGLLLGVAACFLASDVVSQERGGNSKRVGFPNFGRKKTDDIFFRDLFRDGLVGSRPDLSGTPARVVGSPTSPGPGSSGTDSSGGGIEGAADWAKIIARETIEDEIKALNLLVNQDIKTPSDFKGRGYSKARRSFSILAMLFAVTAEYNGDVRWKKDAPVARDLFSRAAGQCKAGTDQSFNAAKLRKQDLQDLVRGQSLAETKPAEAKADWSKVCDRSPLMQRIDFGMKERLQPWTSSEATFKSNSQEIKAEAEMLATIAEVMKQEGMEDADDEDYTSYCDLMKKSAMEIIGAVKLGNLEPAEKAIGVINKACDDCHENYRG